MEPGTRVLTGVAAAATCLLLAGCAEREPPAATFVDDGAGLMTAAEAADVSGWHAALLGQYDIDYRVLTVDRADDLAGLAVRHFGDARVGSQSRSGRGLLLVVDAGSGRVRLEVARELEGVFVDSFVAFVEREQLAPFFAAGRVGDGIVATSELIAGRAQAALAAAAPDVRDAAASSAGAGAESAAGIGGGYERPTARVATDTGARAAPLDTVAAYLAAMAAHEGSPDLDLYSAGTRGMLAGHVMTRAQMDNLVRTYRGCPAPRVQEQGDHAVIDHPGDPGGCAPWFLARDADGLWRLDLLTMQRAIRFDTRNNWRVAAPEALGGYAYAFAD
jgi:uncharacterized protein